MDTMPVNGVPTRVITSSRSGEFTCHAFSEDGSRLALGESNGAISLWHSGSLERVAELPAAFAHPLSDLSFVNEDVDHLIAVDRAGIIREFRCTSGRPQEGPSRATTERRIDALQTAYSSANPGTTECLPLLHQFSSDGRILACVKHRDPVENNGESDNVATGMTQSRQTSVEVNGLQEPVPSNLLVKFDGPELCVPLLSKNGTGLLAPILREQNIDMSIEAQRRESEGGVWVVPELDLYGQKEPKPFKLQGQRAFWGRKGDLALVWDTDDGRPRLSVYTTKTLQKARALTPPKCQLSFRRGLLSCDAQEMPSADSRADCEILVSQTTQNRRYFLIWNIDKDTVSEEISVPLKLQRLSKRSGTQSSQSSVKRSAELDQPRTSLSAFAQRVAKDVYPTFCSTKDRHWIGAIGCDALFGSLSCIGTGTAVWDFESKELNGADNSRRLEHATFDPMNQSFLVFAGKEIVSFSPRFLVGGLQSRSDTGGPWQDLDLDNDETEKGQLVEGYHCLPCSALIKACKMKANANQHFLGFPLPTERDIIFMDAALDADGDVLALLLRRSDGSSFITTADLKAGGTPREKTFESLVLPATPRSDERAFIPDRLFMFKDCQADESLAVFSTGDSPAGLWIDFEADERTEIPLRMNKCLHISRSNDMKTLALLDVDRVVILSLEGSQIIKEIPYNTNFVPLIETMRQSMRWSDPESEGFQLSTERRISDDGTAVLLAWDTKNLRSIVVTPDMHQNDCEALINAADNTLSSYCQLCPNGRDSIYISVEDCTRGRITIRFYSEARGEETRSIVADKSLPRDLTEIEVSRILSNVACGLSPDGTLLVTQTLTSHRPRSYQPVLRNRIKVFTVHAIAEYAANYDPSLRRATSVDEWIAQMYAEKGFSAFNAPTSKGTTIFIDAFLEKNQRLIHQITQIALNHKGELGLQWKTAAGWSDILKYAMESPHTNYINEAVKLVCSALPPFRNAASIMERSFKDLVMKQRAIAQDLLKKNALVYDACQLKVHVDFLNSRPGKETADHLVTSDSCTEWTVWSDERVLGDLWRNRNQKLVDGMEKNDNKSVASAFLKIVRTANAAKTGMEGIVRPLLLAKVPAFFFEFDVVKWVVIYKWHKIWKKKALWYVLPYAGFLILFTLYAIFLANTASLHDERKQTKILISGVFIAAFLIGFMAASQDCRRIMTYMRDGKEHFKSRRRGLWYFLKFKWNVVNMLSHLLLIFVIPTLHCLTVLGFDCDDALAVFVALESIVAFAKVWYFAQPVNGFGAFVRMINDVITDCIAFLLLGFDILIGFSVALHVVFKHSSTSADEEDDLIDDIEEAFGSLPRSMLTLFYALLGGFEQKIYLDAGRLSWLTALIFPLYMLTQMVVLLNFLISIMGDTFDKVKSKEEARLLNGRAEFIDWCEAGLRDSDREHIDKSVGKFLQVLVAVKPQHDKDHSSQWAGRLRTIASDCQTLIEASEERIMQRINNLEKKLFEEIKRLHDKVNMQNEDRRFEMLLEELRSLRNTINMQNEFRRSIPEELILSQTEGVSQPERSFSEPRPS